jgi:beta-aspartyl-peptidase (threonine type)
MSDESGTWALILHGGAKTIPPGKAERNRRGLLQAAAAGGAVLAGGGAAIDAVGAAIRVLEDDATFNAGFGSVLNADGDVEMDAAIMDGSTLNVGGVGAVRGVRNPISLARKLLYERPTLLVADGARRFAGMHGIELCRPEDMICPEQAASEARDTVGCVALDGQGNVAAGTSTGGLSGKIPGRIGDSPIPGCGLYADNVLGGVSLSGDGESISRTLLAARAMRGLEIGDARAAAAGAIEGLARVGGEAGCIVLDRRGGFGCAHNSEHFAVGLSAKWLSEPLAFLHQAEMQGVLVDV